MIFEGTKKSTLVGLKLAMITYMEGNLYMGMDDHFVNNTIVNLLHYLLVLAVVLIFGYAFNWVNQLPVYVLAGMCGAVLILCCYLDISRVKADIDEINGLCENRL